MPIGESISVCLDVLDSAPALFQEAKRERKRSGTLAGSRT